VGDWPLQVNSKKDVEIRIAVLGTSYVGLVSAACFAQGGHRVTCVVSAGTFFPAARPPAAMKRCAIQPGFEGGMSSIAAEIRECLSVLIAGNRTRFVKEQQS
jgi:hypothetical protein